MNQYTKHILHQVPVDYYQQGVKHHILQKLWHTNKVTVINELIMEYKSNPKNILDVGCASGWLLSEVNKSFPTASCVGVDLYGKAITWAKKQYKTMTFVSADAHKLPMRKSTFDVVVCTEVLEHVEDPGKVLGEIKRVMKKDGIAIIEMDTGNWLFSSIWYIWTHWLKGKVWEDAHIHVFNTDVLRKTIKQSGFVIKKEIHFNVTMAVAFLVTPKSSK